MTYRDDFSKYSGRSNKDVLEAVFTSIPKNLGSVTKYSNLNRGSRTDVVKKALELLVIARVCHKVSSVSAEGVPLGATVNPKKFKALFIDVGLATAALGFIMDVNFRDEELVMINNGSIAEQVVGQLLRAGIPHYMDKELYYWSRDKKGAEAEVDYITSYGQTIVPIEVKAGKTGSMKSLHSLMHSKSLSFAIRVNSDLPSRVHVEHGLRDGIKSNYDLLSLPCYMVEQIPRFLADEMNQLK